MYGKILCFYIDNIRFKTLAEKEILKKEIKQGPFMCTFRVYDDYDSVEGYIYYVIVKEVQFFSDEKPEPEAESCEQLNHAMSVIGYVSIDGDLFLICQWS